MNFFHFIFSLRSSNLILIAFQITITQFEVIKRQPNELQKDPTLMMT